MPELAEQQNVGRFQPDTSGGDLIARMLTAYNMHKFTESTTAYEKMTAAARVIADALLGPATFNEAVKFGPGCQTEDERSFKVDAMLAARRARIEAKTKTPEERVKIEEVATYATDGSCHWEKRLYRDGNEVKQIDVLNYAYHGLIEQLKKEEADRTRVESR